MNWNLVKSGILGLAAVFVYATESVADKICVAGNFDGSVARAEHVLDICKNAGSNAVLLMGDYSSRDKLGSFTPFGRRLKTDFGSSKEVLDVFGESDFPVYVLSGSNDNLDDVAKISNAYDNMVSLEDNVSQQVADITVLPLNGYNSETFMFEGARLVSNYEMDMYRKQLESMEDVVSVTHISPYGDIDKVEGVKSVGDEDLEVTLDSGLITSISSAIRESPGIARKQDRWKINPGMFTLVLETSDGRIVDYSAYK